MSDAAASVASASPVSGPGGAEDVRILFRLGPLDVTRRMLVRSLLAVVLVAAVSFFWGRLEIAELHARAKSLPGLAVIAAITVLPLVGFPVSFLHLIAGVRFDFWGGILVVALTTVFHHVLGWALVRVLPRRWFQRIEPWRRKLGGGAYLDTTLLCCLLPGMPYTVQLYLKPLIGTPFYLMFGLSPLLHTARAVVTILLGDMSDKLTPPRVAALAAYYATLFTVSVLSLRRLRRAIAMKNTDPIDPAHISARARHLWQLAGSPPGREHDFRRQAESELKKERAQTAEQKSGQPAGALSPCPGTPSESVRPRS